MESLWYIEYDIISIETDFFKINFTSLLEQAVSDPDALSLSQLYNFSNNKFEHSLQKFLSEFLEIFKNFFQDLLEISENENLTNFSKSVLLYIQVERLYFLSYWRLFGVEGFVLNRLVSSYLRIKNLLTSFHVNCFPKLYRSKELGEAVSGTKHRKRFSLTKSDQGSYDLLFKRNEELKFFQNYLCTAFESLIKECKKQKSNVENISNFFKKTLHYCKNIINKNAYYLKQENENLFGNVVEKGLIEKIMTENKAKMELVRKEIEKERSFEDRLKRNKNTSCVKFEQDLRIFANHMNPNFKKSEKNLENEEADLKDEGKDNDRKVSIRLSPKNKKTPRVSFAEKPNDLEENKKKDSKSEMKLPVFKSKGKIPPPPPMTQAMKQEKKLIEDPLIKESIMKSLNNYFKREESSSKLPEISEKNTSETLHNIRSNITDVIEESKINKYKNMNEKINSNLEILIEELAQKKKVLAEAYLNIQLEGHLYFRESKAISINREKYHSIEMELVGATKYTDESPKLTSFRNTSIHEKLAVDRRSQNAKSKVSELNVIKENDENDFKDKIDSVSSVATSSNLRNTHANTTLTSPLLRSSHENSSAFTNIWNFFRKSIKFSPRSRLLLKQQTSMMINRSNKLNVSEKDIIKIDSNTEINEELKYVQKEEKMLEDMVRDEDLFQKEFFGDDDKSESNSEDEDEGFLSKEKLRGNTTFLKYLHRTRNEEILKKKSVFFNPEVTSLKVFFQSSNEMSGSKSKVFNALGKNRQIQNEIQKILTQPCTDNFLQRSQADSFSTRTDPAKFFNVFEKIQ